MSEPTDLRDRLRQRLRQRQASEALKSTPDWTRYASPAARLYSVLGVDDEQGDPYEGMVNCGTCMKSTKIAEGS